MSCTHVLDYSCIHSFIRTRNLEAQKVTFVSISDILAINKGFPLALNELYAVVNICQSILGMDLHDHYYNLEAHQKAKKCKFFKLGLWTGA